MAILRGGKRIDGYDIRIGLPRDRSLDNVGGDKRLKQRAGPTTQTTIGNFISKVNIYSVGIVISPLPARVYSLPLSDVSIQFICSPASKTTS